MAITFQGNRKILAVNPDLNGLYKTPSTFVTTSGSNAAMQTAIDLAISAAVTNETANNRNLFFVSCNTVLNGATYNAVCIWAILDDYTQKTAY